MTNTVSLQMRRVGERASRGTHQFAAVVSIFAMNIVSLAVLQ